MRSKSVLVREGYRHVGSKFVGVNKPIGTGDGIRKHNERAIGDFPQGLSLSSSFDNLFRLTPPADAATSGVDGEHNVFARLRSGPTNCVTCEVSC